MQAGYAAHLNAWLNQFVAEPEREQVLDDILAFEMDYPDIITDGHSWTEIRFLAERYRQNRGK